MKKNNIILIILMVIILLGTLSFTYSYFTMEEDTNTVITFGNLKLKLIETTLKDGEYVNVFNNDSINITNTTKLSRIVKVENVGNNPFYLRLQLVFSGIGKDNKSINASDLISIDAGEDWIYENGYYYYKYSLNSKETTTELMREIKFDNKTIVKKYPGSKFNLKILAQAVQSEHNSGNVLEATGWPS